jgi:MFS family permease
MFLIGYSHDIITYTFASIIFGIATGISSPTLFAWTADLSHPERRGIGTGTMFIALELGIMFGSASTLLTYDNSIKSIPTAFITGTILAIIAFFYLIWHIKKRESLT